MDIKKVLEFKTNTFFVFIIYTIINNNATLTTRIRIIKKTYILTKLNYSELTVVCDKTTIIMDAHNILEKIGDKQINLINHKKTKIIHEKNINHLCRTIETLCESRNIPECVVTSYINSISTFDDMDFLYQLLVLLLRYDINNYMCNNNSRSIAEFLTKSVVSLTKNYNAYLDNTYITIQIPLVGSLRQENSNMFADNYKLWRTNLKDISIIYRDLFKDLLFVRISVY